MESKSKSIVSREGAKHAKRAGKELYLAPGRKGRKERRRRRGEAN